MKFSLFASLLLTSSECDIALFFNFFCPLTKWWSALVVTSFAAPLPQGEKPEPRASLDERGVSLISNMLTDNSLTDGELLVHRKYPGSWTRSLVSSILLHVAKAGFRIHKTRLPDIAEPPRGTRIVRAAINPLFWSSFPHVPYSNLVLQVRIANTYPLSSSFSRSIL